MSKFGSRAQHGQRRLDFIDSVLPRLHAVVKGNTFLKGIGMHQPKERGSQSGKLKKQIPDVHTGSHGGWGLPEPGPSDRTPTAQSTCI